MRFSYSQNALALLLAALSLFASADAKVKKNKTELQAAYPDPRVHPSSCGRKGLSKSHICDPHGVLSRASQDRVDLIARSASVFFANDSWRPGSMMIFVACVPSLFVAHAPRVVLMESVDLVQVG